MSQQDHSSNPAQRIYAWCVLAIFALHLPGTPALAGPSGETVVHGEATFTRDGNDTLIETGTDETIVDYDNFDIAVDETVRIDQPHSHSRILNRVPFGDPSQIDGELSSNGIVYILNPAGVFLGDTAVIDVNGLVAAAGDLSNQEFLAGQDVFTLSGDVVVADGARIDATDSVALLGRRVANFGTIEAQGGYVAFVAGDRAVLGKLNGRLAIHVDGGDPDLEDFALTQAGQVGGPHVSLSAGDTYSLAMNHTGVTHGRDLELRAGGNGLVQVAGELDARGTGEGETGGRIYVLGDKIALLDATLDASGNAGGGAIRVGGDVRGEGDLPKARRLYVAPEAVLRADAIETGDGGSIVAWSEEKTGFFGTASATGGGVSGDGGFIEISGRTNLEARGHSVDVTAANGKSGKLLYDPDRILIIGGTDDGSDEVDVANDTLEGSDGTLGRILEGDVGDGSDPFVIYESEIEGTDADIELIATTQISTSGSFDDNDVVVLPTNSLVIRTTGEGDPGDANQIDLTADGNADDTDGNNDDLRWVVSRGGVIVIQTTSGTAEGLDEDADGNIRVGSLEFQGRDFVESPTPGIFGPAATPRPISVNTTQGDITIAGSIIADGAPSSGGGARFDSAEDGGDITLATLSGDIVVEGTISSRGGDAIASSPSAGGSGGLVRLRTEDGSVSVLDDIDVSGGDGAGGSIAPNAESVFISGIGGRAGGIALEATEAVNVGGANAGEGDLIARGGDAVLGNNQDPETGLLSFTNGGQGGQLLIEAGSVRIDGGGTRIDMSGGDGQVAGGNGVTAVTSLDLRGRGFLSREDLGTLAVNIEATDGDIELVDVQLDASGGDAGAFGGPGGAGGRGGNVRISSLAESVTAPTLQIDTRGGAGFSVDLSGSNLPVGTGGSGGGITLLARDEINAGAIDARGGAGDNGNGGAGGLVAITGGSALEASDGTGDITLNDIDTTGGDAGGTMDDAFLGGQGGSITVRAEAEDLDAGPSVVMLGGGIGGLGGAGAGDDGVDGVGASVSITALDGSIESGNLTAGIASRNVALNAANIGAELTPVRVAGTPGDDDIVTVTTADVSFVEDGDDTVIVSEGGASFLEVVDAIDVGSTNIGGDLETLRLVHNDSGDDVTALFTEGGETLLQIAGDDDGQTVLIMQTDEASDPRLEYSLLVQETRPDRVTIAGGAVNLSERGGSIASIGTIEGGAGGGTHVQTDGDFTLDATSIGADTEVVLRGDAGAALRLIAAGDVDAQIDEETFGAFAIVQRDATGTVDVTGVGGAAAEVISILPDVGDPDAPVSEVRVATVGSFSYELDGTNPTIRIHDLAVGDAADDDAKINAVAGQILLAPELANPAVQLAGGRLTLQTRPELGGSGGNVEGGDLNGAAAHIALGGTGAEGELLLDVGGSVDGTTTDGLVTTGLAKLAGVHGAGLRITNRDGDELEITELVDFDVASFDEEADTTGVVFRGVQSLGTTSGDTFIENDVAGGLIVLGDVEGPSAAAGSIHVFSGGDLELRAENGIRVSNARFYFSPDEEEVEFNHDAQLIAGGDIVLGGEVNGEANAMAMDNRGMDALTPMVDPEAIDATLTLTSGGVVRFEGDVGTGGPGEGLARLDTTAADITDDDRTFVAEELVFRGGMSGGGGATFTDEDGAAELVAIGGNVNVGAETGGGFTVNADEINFAVAGGSSADQVDVTGDLTLRANTTGLPSAVATITDTDGGLNLQSTGELTVDDFDKISVTGNLRLASNSVVRVSDVSADNIRIDSPRIEIVRRDAQNVELADGSVIQDGGVDFVANSIRLSSSPNFVGAGTETPTFYLGSGGVSLPGGLNGIELRRLNPKLSSVNSTLFFGQDGQVLDLTGSGPALVARATSDIPREEPQVLPDAPPEFGADAPTSLSPLAAPAVLAFLRCGEAGLEQACEAGDEQALQSLTATDRAGLATARALEVTQRYRDLVSMPGADSRLREQFAEAGRAYAAATGWTEGEAIDGAVFYAFLEQAKLPAFEALRELSWLHTQIQLLGMSEPDTRRLQGGLADEFAEAAGLPGFSGKSALEAVEASPIGLPSRHAAVQP